MLPPVRTLVAALVTTIITVSVISRIPALRRFVFNEQ